MTPQYIQRSRKKGAAHPKGTVWAIRPYLLQNRYAVKLLCGKLYVICLGDEPFWTGTKEQCTAKAIELFRDDMELMREKQPTFYAARMKYIYLAQYISCWCPVGSPCHVQDVLIPLAEEWAKSQVTA